MATPREIISAGLGRTERSTFLSGGLDPKNPAPIRSPGAFDDFLVNRSSRVPDFDSGSSDVTMFFKSALSSGTKELFGGLPERDVEKFRAANPVGSFFSHVLGTVPFFVLPTSGIGVALGSKVPGVVRGLKAASNLKDAGSPFLGGGLELATRFAPFEAARIAGSALSPDPGSIGRATQSAVGETIFLGGLGGVGGLFRSFRGTKPRESQLFDTKAQEATEGRISQFIGESPDKPGFNRDASTQTKYDFLRTYKETTVTPETPAPIVKDIDDSLVLYDRMIKHEEPFLNQKGKQRHVSTLVNGATAKVESLFHRGGVKGGRVHKGVEPRKLEENLKGETGGYTEDERGALQVALAEFNQIAPDGYQGYTQYLRKLDVLGDKGFGALLKTLGDSFVKIGENQWIAREANDGLYVGIKAFQKPTQGNIIQRARDLVGGGENKSYFIFKTNKPAKWFKEQAGLSETNSDLFHRGLNWRREANVPDSTVPQLVLAENMARNVEAANAGMHSGRARVIEDEGLSAVQGSLTASIDRYLPKEFLGQNWVDLRKEVAGVLGDSMNKLAGVTAPARAVFSRNPRGVTLLHTMTRIFQMGSLRSLERIQGKLKPEFLDAGSSPVGSILRTAFNPKLRREGGMEKSIRDALTDNQVALRDFNNMNMNALTPTEVAASNLDPVAKNLYIKMKVSNEQQVQEVINTARATGTDLSFIPAEWHIGLVSTWRGSFRIPIVEAETDAIIGFGSGFNAEQAGREAIAITEAFNAQAGKKVLQTYSFNEADVAKGAVDRLVKGNVSHAGELEIDQFLDTGVAKLLKDLEGKVSGLPADLSSRQADLFWYAPQIAKGNKLSDQFIKFRASMFDADPKRFLPTKKLIGARGSPGTPFTVDDVVKINNEGIIEMDRFISRMAFANGPMKDQLSKFAAEDPIGLSRFNTIFNSLNGVQGPVARVADGMFDKAMSSWFGPGAAMRAVRGANEAVFMLTLGAWDIGFAALNLITPVQTAIPELANILGAAAGSHAKWYSSYLVRMPEGGVRPAKFLDTLKFAKQGLRDLIRPDAEAKQWIKRAVDENIISRQLVETVHGGMRAVAEGEGGVVRNFMRFMEAPVVASEEVSRAYAYTLGRRAAKDFWKLGDEDAHQFAAEFVQRTMFGYSAAERPRILNGAMGAGWGLFKNWTTNYVTNLAGYTSQAARGNWHPLLWSMMGTGAVGGVTAVPFVGVAEGFQNLFTDKSIDDFIYDVVGNDTSGEGRPVTADLLAHGFPSLLGFSLRSRANAPSSHLATDIFMYANMAIWDRAVAMGDAIGSTGASLSRGDNPMTNPKFRRDMMRAFAPRTLQRAMTTFGQDGMTSLKTGNSVVPALSTIEKSLATIGLTPIKVAKIWEVQQEAWKDTKAKSKLMSELTQQLADSELNGDYNTAERVTLRAIESGLPLDSIASGAMTRIRNQQQPFLDRQADDMATQARRKARGIGF